MFEYRHDDFCAWVGEVAGVESAEVALRLAMLDPKTQHKVVADALRVLLPHVLHYIADDIGTPENMKPDSPIYLPNSVLRALGRVK